MKKYFSKEYLLKYFYSFVWVSLLVFICDIISKWAVQSNLKFDNRSVELIPHFLYVTLSHNTGASFGIGNEGSLGWRIAWIIISVILTGVLIFVFVKYFGKFTKLQKIALSLMIGGAFSNFIDRAFYWEKLVGFNGVIDWIDFEFGGWHFATFNLADSALVIGVFILLIIELVALIKEVREKDKRGEYDIAPNAEKKSDENNQDKQ